MKNSGEKQNRKSEVGMAKASGHPEKVSTIEHCGSPGGTGQRFKMPKEVVDHSNVRKLD